MTKVEQQAEAPDLAVGDARKAAAEIHDWVFSPPDSWPIRGEPSIMQIESIISRHFAATPDAVADERMRQVVRNHVEDLKNCVDTIKESPYSTALLNTYTQIELAIKELELVLLPVQPACLLCEKGFPVENGEHYGTQSAGMIPTSKCIAVQPTATPDAVGDAANGISWSALLTALERLRSKNRNSEREWYHGWNAAIQCLINDINARSLSASTTPNVVAQARKGTWKDAIEIVKGNIVFDMHGDPNWISLDALSGLKAAALRAEGGKERDADANC